MHDPAFLTPSATQPYGVAVDALQLIADAVICTDEFGSILLFNHAAQVAFGYSLSEVIGQPVEMLLPQSFTANHASQVKKFALEGRDEHRLMGARSEVVGRHKDGTEFPSEATVSRHVVNGHIILTVVHHDISKRKELENQREIIAQELDHRIKNIFTVFSALIHLSAHGIADVKEFKAMLLKRLSSLARTQVVLRSGGSQSTDLEHILLDEMASYGLDGHANIIINGPAISVSADAAQALAMTFHELATNATKYGALSNPVGRLMVSYDWIKEGAQKAVVVEWREAGGPRVVPPTRVGFGSKLITQVIRSTFGTNIVLEYPEEGFFCRMMLPEAKLLPHALDS